MQDRCVAAFSPFFSISCPSYIFVIVARVSLALLRFALFLLGFKLYTRHRNSALQTDIGSQLYSRPSRFLLQRLLGQLVQFCKKNEKKQGTKGKWHAERDRFKFYEGNARLVFCLIMHYLQSSKGWRVTAIYEEFQG